MLWFPVWCENFICVGVPFPSPSNEPVFAWSDDINTIALHILPAHAIQSFDSSCQAELSFGASSHAATHPCVI